MGKDYDDINDGAQTLQGVMEAAPAYQVERFLRMMPETDGNIVEGKPDEGHPVPPKQGDRTTEDYPMPPDPEDRMTEGYPIPSEQRDRMAEGYPALPEMGDRTTEGYPALPEQGEKTIEDYLALPDERRVELIDGVFYDMAAPTPIHQSIAMNIWKSLDNFVEKNKGTCVPFAAPIDVQLFGDDKTMVQPDVFVVCDKDNITRVRLVGAPDLIVEVASPSSWKIDAFLKLTKYRQAGVREYWIVFPDEKKVLVYHFEESRDLRGGKDTGGTSAEYTFADKVPVGIWDGKCEVNFADIYERYSFLYE